jgi:hypothetical protein
MSPPSARVLVPGPPYIDRRRLIRLHRLVSRFSSSVGNGTVSFGLLVEGGRVGCSVPRVTTTSPVPWNAALRPIRFDRSRSVSSKALSLVRPLLSAHHGSRERIDDRTQVTTTGAVPAQSHLSGGTPVPVLLEILRLAFAWGICALVVLFWYYIMSRLGTF